MENKYFTPSLEDIRVGYECEFHGMTVGGLTIIDFSDESKSETIREPDIKVWSPIKCGYDPWINEKTVEEIKRLLENNQIRTLYLTKEQIEAEGWKAVSDSQFYKKDVVFSFQSSLEKVTFWEPAGDVLFNGECKDINTFRYICKLLNI